MNAFSRRYRRVPTWVAVLVAFSIIGLGALVASRPDNAPASAGPTITLPAAACDIIVTTTSLDNGSHVTVRTPLGFVMFPASYGYDSGLQRYGVYAFEVVDHGHNSYSLLAIHPPTTVQLTDWHTNASAC